jgi:circadian clock protein KaiC
VSDDQPTADESRAILAQPLAPTGVRGLDQVLGQGLPRGALAIIMGPPGSGKTVLANQIAFAAARAGQRAVVFTALAESTSNLIIHLRSFTFFDDELVGNMVQLLSMQQFLRGGLRAAGDELVAAARRARASVVVLDGFRGVRGVDLDPQAARQFLYNVGTTLSVLGGTTIITSEADPRDPAFFPEATTADVIIGLHYTLNGVRQMRALEAIKVRGSAPLPGLHGLQIENEGAVVYPRLEARIGMTSRRQMERTLTTLGADTAIPESAAGDPVPFGVAELDTLLGGGLTRDTSTLLAGGPGTGKTLISLLFALAGARAGEPTVFLGFRESLRQLLLKADSFGVGGHLREALRQGGLLTLLRWAPVELTPDIVADQLLTVLDRVGARRLVVDSISEVERAVLGSGNGGRVDNYLGALIEALRDRSVTGIFIKETRQSVGSRVDFADEPASVLAENVLLLEQLEQRGGLHRVLSVLKTRFAAHDATLWEFAIAPPDGIRLIAPLRRDVETPVGTTFDPSRTGAGPSQSEPPRGHASRRGQSSGQGTEGASPPETRR